jgi:hypothetical protein
MPFSILWQGRRSSPIYPDTIPALCNFLKADTPSVEGFPPVADHKAANDFVCNS